MLNAVYCGGFVSVLVSHDDDGGGAPSPNLSPYRCVVSYVSSPGDLYLEAVLAARPLRASVVLTVAQSQRPSALTAYST